MAARRRGGSPIAPLARRLLLWGTGILGALLLLLALGYAQLLSYLQGESFRDSLAKILTNRAQAESVDIEGTLTLDGSRVSLPGISMQRPGVLQGFQVRQLRAELKRAALFDRELHLTRLAAEEGTFTLNTDDKGEKLPAIHKATSGFWSGFTPTRTRVDRVDCHDFNTALRLKAQDYSLTNSVLSAQPLAGKPGWELRLTGGHLHTGLPLLGNCNLESATLTLGEKVSTLSQGRLMLSPGELITNALYEQKSGNWSAEFRLNRADVARLLKDDWKKRVTGELYGRMEASGNAQGLQQAEGRISLQRGVLEALPILSELPLGNTRPYHHLELEKATARLSYPHADKMRNIRRAWLLDHIDLRAKDNLLRVKGHAMVDEDGSLSGALLIGLPEKVVAAISPLGTELQESLFNARGEAGFLWLRLNLSGTLDDPQEDLSVRLMTLLGNALPDAAGKALGSASDLLGRLFPAPEATSGAQERDEDEDSDEAQPKDKDTTSPGGILKGAGDAAQELIGSGLRGLF